MPWKRRLRQGCIARPQVRYWEKQFLSLTDEAMLDKSMELRGKARGKWDLDKLLPEAFGLVCVAIQRALDIRPFDVQLAAGAVMHFGGLVELATGEGKTVTASLPDVPQRPRRQGRPRHHGQRLPRPARRRVDRPRLPEARPVGRLSAAEDGRRGPHGRVPPRRHLRHRLASSASTSCATGSRSAAGRRQAAPFWAPWMPGGGCRQAGPARRSGRCTTPSWTRPTASSSTRPRRRSSSPTRPAWPSRRSRSSTSGPTASPAT